MKNKETAKVKISVLVGEELVGAHYIYEENYGLYEDLISAIKRENIDSIRLIDNPNDNSGRLKYKTFGFFEGSQLVATQSLLYPNLEGMIAAYQSDPTFIIEEF
jgi:hypothetical protein